MNSLDPRYLGIPNINFSICREDDDREELYSQQRQDRGFDNSELWSLDYTIARFIAPRLKAFRELHAGYPSSLTAEKWDNILIKMERAFNLIIEDRILNDDEEKELTKGMNLFHKYFFALWY